MSFILSPFSMLLSLLNGVFDSYGIAIMIFAVIVKILLFPFSIKGKRGMIQMNMISGEMNQLKKKYGKDPERYNQEVQALYIREQVNPLSGCLWTLLPLFVLLPLYAIIRSPIHYIMGLSDDQIFLLANQVNWDVVAVELQLVTQDMVDKALAKSLEAGGVVSGFANDMYNQLHLASMIPEGGIVLTDGTVVGQMNFKMFGIDLTKIPNWKLWQDFSYQNIFSLFLVGISACSGFVFSKITQKTNKLASNQPRNEQVEQTNRVMTYTMPLMSIWIGLIMPSIMVIYWITNNLTAMVQELVAGQILKKDYEAARLAQEKRAIEEKEQERLEKAEKVKEIERRREEATKNKGKKKKTKKETKPKEETVDKDASREGLRTYARGHAYDPNRYPNPYSEGETEETGEKSGKKKAPDFEAMGDEGKKAIEESKKLGEDVQKQVSKDLKDLEKLEKAEALQTSDSSEEEEENQSKVTQEHSDFEGKTRDISASEEEQEDWEAQKAKLKQELENKKENSDHS